MKNITTFSTIYFSKFFKALEKCLLVLAICISNFAYAQFPALLHNIPIDNGNYKDFAQSLTPVTSGVSKFTDRFGDPNGAVAFNYNNEISYISFNNLPASKYNTKKTVSYWIYIDNPTTIPEGPFPYQETDFYKHIYSYYTNVTTGVFPNEGQSIRGPVLGQHRQYNNTTHWFLWWYKPIEFNVIGWYHIIHVQGQYFTKEYVYKPDGTKQCAFNYLGVQNWGANNCELVLGNTEIGHKPIKALDDFKAFTDELTEAQADLLHNQEIPVENYGNYRIRNKATGKYLAVKDFGADKGTETQAKTENEAGATYLWRYEKDINTGHPFLVNIFANNNKDMSGSWTWPARVLNVKGGSGSYGTILQLWDHDNTNSCKWSLERNPQTGSYKIRTWLNNNPIFHNGGNNQIMIGTDNNDYYEWYFEKVDLSLPPITSPIDNLLTYRLKNRNSNLYMAYDYLAEDNKVIRQKTENDAGGTYIWNLTNGNGNGLYAIQTLIKPENWYQDFYRLDVPSGTTGWTEIKLWKNSSQKWNIFKDTEGFYRIASAVTGRTINVSGASTSAGQAIIQSDACTSNGQWTFEPVNFYKDNSNSVVRFKNAQNPALFMAIDYNQSNNGSSLRLKTEAYAGATYLWQMQKPSSNSGIANRKIYSFPYSSSGYTQKNVDVNGASNDNNTKLQIWDDNSTGSQRWLIYKNSSNNYQIVHLISGKFLGTSLVTENQALTLQNSFTTSWVIENVNMPNLSGVEFTIKNVNSSKYINGSSSGNYQSAYPLNWWKMYSISSNIYKMYYTGYGENCMDLDWNRLDDGNMIKIHPYSDGNKAQQWLFYQDTQNQYRIASASTGKLIVVENASTAENARVFQWGGGYSNSQWIFEPRSSASRLATENTIEQKEENPVLLYPNPTTTPEKVTIEFSLPEQDRVNFQLFNEAGNLVMQEERTLQEGQQSVELSLPPISKEGTHNLRIVSASGNLLATKKIIIIK
ncbi:RICIN domain-containing protein [Emticicia sp. 17c]|uniref:RICIN domain-containing protein n=1 Tax=Emticicia sp. 17c TaxID=3127704 RepID=UPI00301C85D4